MEQERAELSITEHTRAELIRAEKAEPRGKSRETIRAEKRRAELTAEHKHSTAQ
jgi:hypothetical protein